MPERCYVNPHFHLESDAIVADFERMKRAPTPLARPVVILGGWHSPGVANWGVASHIRPFTSNREQDFLSITYPSSLSLAGAGGAAFRRIGQQGLAKTEIDLIGISMGGILARALASNAFGFGELKVKRVFTIASPNRGAKIAKVVIPDSAAWDMRPGSKFLTRLNKLEPGYEVHSYAALRDWWIGARNTSPPGIDPYWVDIAPGWQRICTHFAINHERRVMGDIARRLRGEEGWAQKGTVPPID